MSQSFLAKFFTCRVQPSINDANRYHNRDITLRWWMVDGWMKCQVWFKPAPRRPVVRAARAQLSHATCEIFANTAHWATRQWGNNRFTHIVNHVLRSSHVGDVFYWFFSRNVDYKSADNFYFWYSCSLQCILLLFTAFITSACSNYERIVRVFYFWVLAQRSSLLPLRYRVISAEGLASSVIP